MASADWRAWSKRYQPRWRRTWRVGDRFALNQEGSLVFEITRMTEKTITFWAPDFDTDKTGLAARRQPREKFHLDVRRRVYVRR